MRLIDAVRRDASLGSLHREAVEICLPSREIGDSVFDMQRSHGAFLRRIKAAPPEPRFAETDTKHGDFEILLTQINIGGPFLLPRTHRISVPMSAFGP